MKRYAHIVQTIVVDDFYTWCKLMCVSLSAMRHPIDGINSAPRMCSVFRGQENEKWKITSTFERSFMGTFFPVDKNEEQHLRIKELTVMSAFKRDAMQYLKEEPHDICEWLSLMRHYGAPTRVVDFTESPFIALHFAVSGQSKTNFSVWSFPAQDGFLEQKKAREFVSKRESCITGKQKDRLVKKEVKHDMKTVIAALVDTEHEMRQKREYVTQILGRTTSDSPVQCKKSEATVLIVKPQFNNARICAQAGVLAIPTVLSEPFMFNARHMGLVGLQKIPSKQTITDFAEQGFVCLNDCIVKFVFPSNMRSTARSFLDAANITEKTLFPDLEGVASQFKTNMAIT